VGLFAFASKRHESTKIKSVNISFTEYNDPLISEDNVNKLLIQSMDSVTNLTVENLDLNRSEMQLESNPMIKEAQVSVDLAGQIDVVVEQRVPIARIMDGKRQYLDLDNRLMPLSQEHSVLVPLVTGFKKEIQDELYRLIIYLRNDHLLREAITQIQISSQQDLLLSVRAHDFKIRLGDIKNLDQKMTHFKTMLVKLEREKKLNQVSQLDLRFDHQVVVIQK
jgi:cell division protein FtsQ